MNKLAYFLRSFFLFSLSFCLPLPPLFAKLENFQAADIVVGQPDFASATANNGGRSARSISNPRSPFSDGKRFFVGDFANNRVLIWNSIPTSNFQPADVVVGQPGFTSADANSGGSGSPRSATAQNLFGPVATFSDGGRLIVADNSNNRVLIWNSIPTSNFAPADIVVGQPDFFSGTANNGGRSARSISGPRTPFFDGKKLFVGDFTNNRVLIWNSIPTSNFQPADVVLGQPDFAQGDANNGGRSARSLSQPRSPFSDGKRLFIEEQNNNRLLIYNIGSSSLRLGPQFEQGKAVLGKVFHDRNGNGIQDDDPQSTDYDPESRGSGAVASAPERGIEGVKVVSDTGIYAITDEDGKYHFPYIETGQRILKLDPVTLPEGAALTTESPRKVIVTKGILTKVSFGVKLLETLKPEDLGADLRVPLPVDHAQPQGAGSPGAQSPSSTPLLKVSISQDPTLLKPRLGVWAVQEKDKLLFTIDCNYFLFVKESKLELYDSNLKPLKTIVLPKPLPYRYSIPFSDLTAAGLKVAPPSDSSPYDHLPQALHYQLRVYDKEGHEDRTGVGILELAHS